jgi:hypothetical protein
MPFKLKNPISSVLQIETPIGNEYTAVNVQLDWVTEFIYNDEYFTKYGEMPGNVKISEYCNDSRTLTIFVNHDLKQAFICSYCPPPPKRLPRPWMN